MKRCELHNINFNYICPICEEELRYAGHPNLVKHFRDGFNGHLTRAYSIQEKAAYEYGRKIKKERF